MKTNEDAIPNWELGNARRCMRGIIGAAAILALLLIPGLNEGWLFLLAIIGAYESMTAILNADLVYGVFYLALRAAQGMRRKEAEEDITVSSPLITTAMGSRSTRRLHETYAAVP
jgi:hypothetical protein